MAINNGIIEIVVDKPSLVVTPKLPNINQVETSTISINITENNHPSLCIGGQNGSLTSSVSWEQILNKPIIFPADTNQWIIGEIPLGTIDGGNKTFASLSYYLGNKIRIFLNGIRISPSHYSLSSNNLITLNDAPQLGDELIIDYIKQSV